MTSLRIGLRLIGRGGRREFTRLTLIVLGTTLGVWCLLTALAFPRILEARQDRAEARIPETVRAGDAKGWYHSTERLIGSRPGEMAFVAFTGAEVHPPGVQDPPDTGEAIVSPSLASLLAPRQSVKATFPYEVVGEIADDGLVAPNELFAYVGARRSELPDSALPFRDFGTDVNPEVDIATGDLKLIQLALLGLVGVPLAVYFAVCARLSAATRDRRLAALRLVGLSVKEALRVNAVESVVATVVGSLTGLVVFDLSQATAASSGMGGIVWFPADSDPSLGTVLLCLIGVPLFAGLLNNVGARPAVTHALAFRRQGPKRLPRLWRLVPFVLGLGILSGLVVASRGTPRGVGLGDSGALLLLAGVGLTGAGLVFGFAAVPIHAARAIADRTSRVAVLLGMRRLHFEPIGPTRVAAGIVLAVFGMGFANGLQRDAQAANARIGQRTLFELDAIEIPTSSRARIHDARGVYGVLVYLQSKTKAPPVNATEATPSAIPHTAAWGTCADLNIFLEREIVGCQEGVPYRIVPATGRQAELLDPGANLVFASELRRVDRGPAFSVTVPARTLELPIQDIYKLRDVEMLLPPGSFPGRNIPETATILLASDSDSETVAEVSTSIARIASTATLRFVNQNVDAQRQAEVVQDLLYLALGLGVLVGLAAFLVTALDQMLERRANLVALTIVGVPFSTLRGAQALQVGMSLAAATGVAIVSGKIAEQATVAVGGYEQRWTWDGPLLALGIAAVGTAVAVGVTSLSVTRTLDPSLIRRE